MGDFPTKTITTVNVKWLGSISVYLYSHTVTTMHFTGARSRWLITVLTTGTVYIFLVPFMPNIQNKRLSYLNSSRIFGSCLYIHCVELFPMKVSLHAWEHYWMIWKGRRDEEIILLDIGHRTSEFRAIKFIILFLIIWSEWNELDGRSIWIHWRFHIESFQHVSANSNWTIRLSVHAMDVAGGTRSDLASRLTAEPGPRGIVVVIYGTLCTCKRK